MDNQQAPGQGQGNNNGRLFLNFQNDTRFTTNDPRMYPTTPSTFPNPIFSPNQAQQQQQQQQQSHAISSQHQQYANGYANQGFNLSNQYQQQQQQQAYFQQQPGLQPGQAYQSRQAPQNDATNGLVHQFSHQNLGGRASPYNARQPSPGQRPRTAGAPGQQPGLAYMNAPMPQAGQQTAPDFQLAPERNPDKFGSHVGNNQKRCAQLSEAFFKDSVKRARDRNVR